MESDCNVVLSLQERCLLYLITHVEDYSPQTLALLPRHLRRALLSSVAPLHLYQLDQTAVASGIETKTLWTGMYYSDRNLAGLTHRWGYQSITSRKSFSSLLTSIIISPKERATTITLLNDALSLETALFGLFHVRLSTGMVRYLQHNRGGYVNVNNYRHCFVNIDALGTLLRHHCQNHRAQSSYRTSFEFFEDYFCSCSLFGRQIRVLYACIAKRFVSALVRASVFPSEVEIDIQKMIHTELWLPELGGPIAPFLISSTVKRLSVGSSVYAPPIITTAASLLKEVLSSPQVCLLHLHIGVPLDVDSLVYIAPMLAAYGRLKTLKVVVGESETSANDFSAPLHRIITSQKALDSLDLSLYKFPNSYTGYINLDDKNLLDSLCALFQNNTFCDLTITGFTLPQGALVEIVAAFFESTPSNDRSTLLFRDVTLEIQTGIANNRRVAISQEHAEKFGLKKCLYLQEFTLPDSFLRWFESIPYLYLDALDVQCSCHRRSDIRRHFKYHPNVKIMATYVP